MFDLIEKKRDGKSLTAEEIQYFVTGYTEGKIPDYQVSALLMAIYFRGMTDEESAALTMSMAHSGKMLDLASINGMTVDKHSTGGVGDTTTLILIPLVASLGIPVAKMSGRGLGHTGGTLDKLEAITNFHVEIDEEAFLKQINDIGLALIGQSKDLVPADRLLYSLRDVTATVDSIPLIASSITRKKIASGADKLVLDVKVGQGAFMKSLDEAKQLAETMVAIGKHTNRETIALITNMDQPLGREIGNALEVKEAIETLQGKGPEDLTELVLELGAYMAILGEKATSLEEAKEKLQMNIANGKAIHYFKQFIKAQHGDERVVDHLDLLPRAPYQQVVYAEQDGFVSNLVAHELGRAAMMLGAGRATKDDTIDLAVGLTLHKKVGDAVVKGDPLCTIHAQETDLTSIKQLIQQNIHISKAKKQTKLILDLVAD